MTSSAVYMELKISILRSPISGQGTMKLQIGILQPSHSLQLESPMQELLIIVWPLLFQAT